MSKKENRIEFSDAENSLKSGNVAMIRAYFRKRDAELKDVLAATEQQPMQQHQQRSALAQEKYNILHELIDAPERFSEPGRAFEVITEGNFDFDDFFIHSYGIVDASDIVAMYAISPTPEVAEVAGIFLGEHIKHQLSWDTGYRLNFGDLIKDVSTTSPDSLSAESNRVAAMNAVIAVQNAMVDYVAENAVHSSPDRAARYLSERREDFKHIADLWTQKIESIQEIKKGPANLPVNYKPVFEPR